MCKIIKRPPLGSIQEYCEDYFEKYNASNNYRKAWLAVRKKRYQEIVDKGFYLKTNAETFKDEVMKFWERGWGFENSKIRKKSGGEINFQDENGETQNSEEIIKELENNNLELHGNYSWSQLYRGGDITADWRRFKEVLYYLLKYDINDDERFIKFNKIVRDNGEYKIRGMSNGKTSMFLHIKYPDKYGVWNSCTDTAFKIFKTVDSEFDIAEKMREVNIRGNNIGEKYKIINEQLKGLLENYNCQEYENGFENLSDVDIFVWYVANYF